MTCHLCTGAPKGSALPGVLREPVLPDRFRGRARSLSPPSLVFAVVWTIAFASLAANAEVKLANIFGSGGILQHGKPVPVWGLADPGEPVTVTLKGVDGSALFREVGTVANIEGKWVVTFDPLTAGDQFHLEVVGSDSRASAHNLQAGDIWFYAGRYRFRYMRLIPTMNEAVWEEDREKLAPYLRLYQVGGSDGSSASSRQPQRSEDGRWMGPTVHTIFGFSPGIAIHFAIEQIREKQIPVGIIYAASMEDHWIDEYLPVASCFHDPVLGQTERVRELAFAVGGTDACRTLNAERIAYMEAYLDASIRDNQAGLRVKYPAFPMPPEVNEMRIGGVHNARVHPLLPLAVKGIIFNDPGGPNPMDVETHTAKLALLIDTLRTGFNNPELPVYVIQARAQRSQNANRNPVLFAAQQKIAQAKPHVERVVWHDMEAFSEASDILLKKIPAIGKRLHAQVGHRLDGINPETAQTPKLIGLDLKARAVALTFSMPLTTSDGRPADGFAIGNRPARADIQGVRLIVEADGRVDPASVTYGFVNSAIQERLNVVGVNGMPIPAFSTRYLPGKEDE